MDGNFEQARLRHAGSGDQPVPKGGTFFLPTEEVLEARRHVEEARKPSKKSQANHIEDDSTTPGLFMPNYVYHKCEDRFLAAGETNKKSEASVFEDTGLMALVCRHDRPLFVVTLRDPGERQYNAVALVNRLFKELPSSWRVGLLYDIGCQMHSSIVKVRFPSIPVWFIGKLIASQYNLLPAYSSRITWGVSTFHAFGHEFPCQAMYHPQKREGFGFTDGEGCERLWASLQKLIPGLRVSGV